MNQPRSISASPADRLTGHLFRDPALLERALTHRSLAFESDPETALDPLTNNEQMEFVGDAVLGLVAAEYLYRRFPDSREGELTRLRASLVSRVHLGRVGERIGIGKSLRLGRGEERTGGRQKTALLANALEAVIAALYLDAGLPAARKFIEQHVIEPSLPDLARALGTGGTFSGAIGDFKSALQERLQAIGGGRPSYVTLEETGPDHQRRFRVEVRLEADGGVSEPLGEAVAGSKKAAQQEAARIALSRTTDDRNADDRSANKDRRASSAAEVAD